jgi:uncharacterized protein (TIGR03437 family)
MRGSSPLSAGLCYIIKLVEDTMDAVKTHLNRVAFIFMTLALAVAAPWTAQAQTFSPTSYGPIQLAAPIGSQVTISGTGGIVTFTASSIAYFGGDPAWLQFGLESDFRCIGSSTITYTTGQPITMNTGCFAPQLLTGTHTAIVTLTDKNNASDTATVTVNYTAGSGSGGNGTITASSTSVTLSAAVGATASQNITLSTSTNGSLAYTTVANPVSWLTVSPTSGTVSAGPGSTLNLFANAASYSSPTTLQATVTINYGVNQQLPITVTFLVGGGGSNGTLVLSQNPVSWSYATGGSLPPQTGVTILNSTASTYGLTFSGSPLFLTANGSSSNTNASTYSIGTQITLAPNGNINSSLATGTYYNYITVTDANGRTVSLEVILTVNSGSGNGTITVTPNPIALSGTYPGNPTSVTVTISSTISGNLSTYITTPGMTVENAATYITAGTPVNVLLYGTPSQVGSAGSYTGSYNVTVVPSSGTASSISVTATFTVSGSCTGSGCNGTSGTAVAPSSLQFNYELGGSGLQSQSVSINGTTGGSDTYSISTPSQTWLQLGSSQGPAPAVVAIYIASPSTLPVGTSTATFNVTTTIAGYTSVSTVTVNVLVSSNGSPVLIAQTNNAGSINLTYSGGTSNPSTGLYLYASDSSSQAFTATPSASWITLNSTSGSTPASLTVTIHPSTLPNGLNSGNISVSGNFGTITIPVVVYVTGSSNSSGVLTLSQSSLSFNAVYGGSAPASQSITVSANSATSFSTSVSGTYGGVTWLTISPSGSLTTTMTITAYVNQSGLQLGTYSGSISLVTSGGTQTIPVTLIVSLTGTALTINPTSLSFSYTSGGAAPAGQTVTVTTTGSTSVTFALADSVTSGANWLILTDSKGNAIASGTNENTGFSFVVNANPTGLAAGTYSGTITMTPSGGTAQSLAVTLTVTASSTTVSATPATLAFTYQVGGSTPAAQTISATGAGNAALTFTATATSSGGNWLTVTPSSGTTPASLSAGVTPSGLTAGTYTGTIVVAGSGSATGSTTINVTLTVTAPLPTITAVVNAASFGGSKIAPGEIVTLGGTALGPVNGLGLTLNSAGKVSTTLGNVSVTFNGYPSPLVYVSATQINCVVPYEVAALVSPFVQVTYAGQSSNAFSLSGGASAPGIFTQNGQGSGPGAILNASGTVNGPSAPAAKGTIVVIYMTGEGQTGPAGVTGSVTAVNTSGGPLTPQPLLPIAVTIGGQPATVVFYGEAPGLVAGVMQVNVIVPTAAASGADALVVSVGGNPSQSGVTVSVQ